MPFEAKHEVIDHLRVERLAHTEEVRKKGLLCDVGGTFRTEDSFLALKTVICCAISVSIVFSLFFNKTLKKDCLLTHLMFVK